MHQTGSALQVSISQGVLGPCKSPKKKSNPLPLDRADPETPRAPLCSWDVLVPADKAGGGCAWHSSVGSWRGKAFVLLGRTLISSIPCHFRRGSVMVCVILSRALISAPLRFTLLSFHHYSARFPCIPIGNKFPYYTFFDLGMFVTLTVIRGKKEDFWE